MPPGHTAVEQGHVRWVWENFLQEGSDWEAEDVVRSVWWWEGAEDIPRNTESLVSERGEGSKVWAVTEEAIVPLQLSPKTVRCQAHVLPLEKELTALNIF